MADVVVTANKTDLPWFGEIGWALCGIVIGYTLCKFMESDLGHKVQGAWKW